MIDLISFHSRIAKIIEEKDLKRQNPNAMSKLNSISENINMVIKTEEDMKGYNTREVTLNMVVCTRKVKRESKKICLVRHLRNAIAHWNIEEHPTNDQAIIIRDFDIKKKKRKKNLSCYGILDYSTLIGLMEIGQQ